MKHSLLTLLILVLVSSCSSGPGLKIWSSYFPLEEGGVWEYSVSGGGKAEIVVESFTDSTFLTAINGEPYNFYTSGDGIYNIKDEYITVEGEKVSIGTFHEFYLPITFVDGSTISDSIVERIVYSGDSILFRFKYNLYVEYVGLLKVGDKLYNEVYRIRRIEVRDKDSLETFEWYAPNVGLVKRQEGEEVWELEEWSLH